MAEPNGGKGPGKREGGAVTVRVAPSPTGDPHVGTAYIALFNRALREQRGGRFILRIEDTDQKRSTPESETLIFDALRWLDIAYDEGPDVGGEKGPYRQSERRELYEKYAEQLVDSGKAYRCFCTEERLRSLRKDQMARGDSFQEHLEKGHAFVVRLHVPRGGETHFQDTARGDITFLNSTIDDQVLLKSDGLPTYHLANVVDDHLMGMTHVVRAEEWISSTPKHILLYEAFGWEPPVFLHMPLLRNRDQSKISKRKNPVSLTWYRDSGYLPEAVVNFLALMGYSMPPEKAPFPETPEIFSFEDLVEELDLSRIKTSGPVFDLEKLDSFNGIYIRSLPKEVLADRILAFLAYVEANRDRLERLAETPPSGKGEMAEREKRRRDWTTAALALSGSPPARETVLETLPLVRERLQGLLDWADRTAFLFEEGDLAYDPALLPDKKKTPEETAQGLREWIHQAEETEPWTTGALERVSRSVCEVLEWKVRPLFMSLRVAVTGRKVSPPLFESMEVIGKDRTLARVRRAVNALQERGEE
ncbi:MAG: glutamate--tRNA ligase [Planctomycetota bacterium]|jgi:glutamyl-tRNA synthetase